jgi:hypothetical protein
VRRPARSRLGSLIGSVVTVSALLLPACHQLFLAGNVDANAAETAQAFHNESVEPKRAEILTTADHGTDLLEGNQAEIARNLIVGWLGQHVPVT